MKLSILILAILFLSSTQRLFSQWESIGGPQNVISIYTSDSSIFAGSYIRGLNITTDNGVIWMHDELTIDANTIYDVISHNDTIYAATEKGLYISGGLIHEWKKINYDMQTDAVYNLTRHKDLIVLGTADGRIYYSTNSKKWNKSEQEYSSSIRAMYSDSENMYMVTSDNSFFISTDDARSWKMISTGFVTSKIYDVIVLDNNIYLSTSGNGILISEDRGRSWSEFSKNLFDVEIYSITSVNGLILAGTTSGVYYSMNSGVSWVNLNNGMTVNNVQSLYIDGEYLFAGTTYSGVWRYPVDSLVNPALTKPKLTKPLDNQRVFSRSVKFQWEPVASAYSYKLQVSTDSTFENPEFNIQNIFLAEYTIDSLQLEQKYYWRVGAKNKKEEVFSDPSVLRVYDVALTEPVQPVYPVNDLVERKYIEFTWVPSERAKAYNLKLFFIVEDSVYVHVNYQNIQHFDGFEIFSKQLEELLLPLLRYYWFVETVSFDGRLIPSDTVSFETNSFLNVPADNNEDYFLIYPNPAKDRINLTLNKLEPPIMVNVYDVSGALVHEATILEKNSVIDIQNVTKGVYYLLISTERKQFQEKILIK